MDTTKEYILCAAIWYNRLTPEIIHNPKNTQHGFVLCGRRHHSIIELGNKLAGLTLKQEDTQGFLTSQDRFVDRREAFQIAFKAKQIEGGKLSGELYSEDLY